MERAVVSRPRAVVVLLTALLALSALSGLATPIAHAVDGTVSGTVAETGGAPLPGLEVQAFCWQVPGAQQGSLCDTVTTGPDGSYSFSLTPGEYKVYVAGWPTHRSQFYGGGAEIAHPDSWPVAVADGAHVTGIDVALAPLRAVRGTVTGAGAALPGINVTAYDAATQVKLGGTLTGPDGGYVLRLVSGTYLIGFSDNNGPFGALYYDGADSLATADPIEVAASDIDGIDASLSPTSPVTGLVTVDGAPMGGVKVTAFHEIVADGASTWIGGRGTTTDADGRYRLYLPDGVYRIQFATFQASYPPQFYDGVSTVGLATNVVVAGTEVTGIDAAIVATGDPGPSIAGTVTANGSTEHVGGVAVDIWRWNETAAAWETVAAATVGPDGRYQFPVPAGTYRVGFRDPLHRYAAQFYADAATVDDADDVVVTASLGAAGIDADLAPGNYQSVGGIVTRTDGLSGPVMIIAYEWNQTTLSWDDVASAGTAPDGTYTIMVLPGTYRLGFFDGQSGVPPVYYDGATNLDEATDIVVGDSPVTGVDVVIGPTGPRPVWTMSGTVTVDPGLPLPPDIAVVAYEWDQASHTWQAHRWTYTAPDGTYALELPEGSYRIRFVDESQVHAEVWYDGALAFEIADDLLITSDLAGIDAHLPVNRTLSGTVTVGGGGQPPADVVVVALRWTEEAQWWHEVGWTYLGPDGSYTLPLAAGTYRIVALDLSGQYAVAYYDGAASLEEATDVVVGDTNVNGIDLHLSVNPDGPVPEEPRSDLPPPDWSPAMVLDGPGEAWQPQVVVGPVGGTTIAWQESDGDNLRIWTATRGREGEWSAPEELSPSGADGWDPRLAVDVAGVVTAAWRQWDGNNYRVMVARRPGKRWSTPVAVSASGFDAWDARVASARPGQATVLWMQQDGDGYGIFTSTGRGSHAWPAPKRLSASGEDAWDGQLAMGVDGTAVAVWSGSTGDGRQIRAVTQDKRGRWSSPDALTGPGEVWEPQVAVGADGTAVAVWRSGDGVHDRIRQSAWTPGAGWGEATDLSDADLDGYEPSVAAGADGAFTVIWGVSNGWETAIQATTRHVDGRWTRPISLSEWLPDGRTPRLSAGLTGKVTAVWTIEGGTVESATRNLDQRWTITTQLHAGGTVGHPRIAAGDNGATVAVWEHHTEETGATILGSVATPVPPQTCMGEECD